LTPVISNTEDDLTAADDYASTTTNEPPEVIKVDSDGEELGMPHLSVLFLLSH